MEYVKLGNTGMDVSRLCLGCMGFGDAKGWIHPWVLGEENSRPIIKKAIDLGINFFDTANMYSNGMSEEIVGRALKDYANRDEIVIASRNNWHKHPGGQILLVTAGRGWYQEEGKPAQELHPGDVVENSPYKSRTVI